MPLPRFTALNVKIMTRAYSSDSHPPDSFMPVIKILSNDVFYALSGLNPQKAYGPDGVPPIVLKNCASVLTPCLSNFSVSVCLHLPFLPAGIMPTCNLFLRRVTALTLQTTDL